jgi:hypothetical protein
MCGFVPCEEYKNGMKANCFLQDGVDEAYKELGRVNSICLDIIKQRQGLEVENAALRQERDRLTKIVEKADALAKAAYDCEQNTNFETMRLLRSERYVNGRKY